MPNNTALVSALRVDRHAVKCRPKRAGALRQVTGGEALAPVKAELDDDEAIADGDPSPEESSMLIITVCI